MELTSGARCCGKNLAGVDFSLQRPSLIFRDLRRAKAPLYHCYAAVTVLGLRLIP
jgi:hypothetical protein